VVKPKKKIDRPSIRLIKNFDQDLTDEGLALEGYNLQEIGILKRARQVMKDEGQNPDDALTWVRGEMADDAGVDIEEFMPDFDWGDFPGKNEFATGGRVGLTDGGDAYQKRAEELAQEIFGVMDFYSLKDNIQDTLYKRAVKDIDAGLLRQGEAQGGGVGSLFRKTDRARYSAGTEIGKEVAKYAGKKIKDILDDLMKHKKIRDLVEKTNKKLNESGITKMWKEDRKLDKKNKIIAEKVLAPFVETVDKMTPWKVSDKSSRNATLAWFREELANPEMRKVYHPNWEKGTMVYRGEKTAKNMEYSKKHDSSMFTTGHHPDYTYKPEHVGGFASTSPDQAIRYAVEAEGFPRVTKARLEPTDFQEAAERNVLENPYGVTSDVLLNEEQKAALKTDLLSTGIATVKKYWPFSKGGSVSRQRLYEDGVGSMFRRV